MNLQSRKWAESTDGQFILEFQMVDKHTIFLLLVVGLTIAITIVCLLICKYLEKLTKSSIDKDIGVNTYLHWLGA